MITWLAKGLEKYGPWGEYPPPKDHTMKPQPHTSNYFKQTPFEKSKTPVREVPWICDPKYGMI